MKVSFFSKKWVVVLIHIAAWVLLFSLPFLLRPSMNEDQEVKKGGNHGVNTFYIVNNLLWVGLFYLNALVIIPAFMYKRKATVFIAAHILLYIGYIIIGRVNRFVFDSESQSQPFNWRIHILFTTFIYLFIFAASTAYQMTRDRIKADKLAQEKENENLKTELSLLRSQVSPHFMFNVLNNMVALARKQSELLEPSLIKLSSLMRYMLYDADGDKVTLEKEIDYLQSYIDLQKQRFGKNVTVNAVFNQMDGSYSIEPMLLIPFVENAFKHGTGFIENAQIDIELKAKNGILNFEVRNRFKESSTETKDETSGIGLPNVKRRLNLLYGKNHSLLISENNGWFTTSLQLNLQK